ncbi:Serine/arginine repetitive matrix protein 2 [Xylographa parallela]|nr:Serine/arginine repetitive matrix protein 2 [Xylographa parallela]
MSSRTPSRGRTRSRSKVPHADRSRSPSVARKSPSRSRSPRRSVSPRSLSRSRTPSDRARYNRRNGRARSTSLSRSRSPRRDARPYRGRTYSRSPGGAPSVPKSSKIVVEKLTKNVNEAHLREIFSAYGPIREVDLPMNRQFMTNRGTAYIMYSSPSASEAAIAHMHEAQLDGAVIHVSIVLPRRKFSRSPPPARRGGPTVTIPLPASTQRVTTTKILVRWERRRQRQGARYLSPAFKDEEQEPKEQDEVCEGEVEELHEESESDAAKEEGRWRSGRKERKSGERREKEA